MLQPDEPRDVIPEAQVTVAELVVTLLADAAETVGLVVQPEDELQVVTYPE